MHAEKPYNNNNSGKNRVEKDDKTHTKAHTKNLAEEHDTDLNTRKHYKTPAENTKKFTETPAEKHSDNNNRGDSHPLVDPRPEEAPDFNYSTVVQSAGAEGSIVHRLNVMDKVPHSQHQGDDGNATTKTGNSEDAIAKNPAKRLGKDPDKKNLTRTRTEQRAEDTTGKTIVGKQHRDEGRGDDQGEEGGGGHHEKGSKHQRSQHGDDTRAGLAIYW